MTTRTLRTRSIAAAVLCSILPACGGNFDDGDSESERAADFAESAIRARPYDLEELEVLARSPEVQALNMPFWPGPAPDTSIHVAMSDGVRRAVSLYFPVGFDRAADRAPVVVIEAWYGRAVEATAEAIDLYRAAGFVVAIADVRGVGASFGSLPTFVTEEVRRDQRDLVGWLATQTWSNGNVAVAGFSISALYGEAMAASGAPALRAAIVRASDFDMYANNAFPGGIPNPRILGLVAQINEWMRGTPCVEDLSLCGFLGIPPVDDDPELLLLQAALEDHAANLPPNALASIVYRDDALGPGVITDMSPIGMVEELREAALPARVSASWLDGTTADSALARFRALPDVPMEVTIGATAHSGGVDADPFARTPFQAARPAALEQFSADVAFVTRVLAGETIERNVSYYVLGAGVWKNTPTWPPAGVTQHELALSRSELVEHGRVRPGERSYDVDPSASSGGPFNRWGSQGGEPVFYGDRRAAKGRRLTFDTLPVARDTELVGAAELCLALRVDREDGTVFAYLEDVAPDGRVTHLTEGELRLIHRKIAAVAGTSGCDSAPGTNRSFARADARAVVPGELMHVEIPLLPTAVLVRKGHRVRLSLTGADAGTFPELVAAPTRWSVAYGGRRGSSLTLPLRNWAR